MSQDNSLLEEHKDTINLDEKTLVIHKLKEEDENKEEIAEEIAKNLFSVTNYFSPSNPVVVGKRIKLDIMKNICIPTIKTNIKKKVKSNGIRKTITSVNTSMRSEINKNSNHNNNLSNKELMELKFEKIDNQRLKNIFNSFRDNSIKQSFTINNSKEEYIPLNISQSLNEQTRNLNIKNNSEKKNSKLGKYLSKKLNKKEKDLLMNRIDVFKLKKEIYNDIENSKPIEQKYGKHKWLISLRRPDNFIGIRDSYINIRNESNPFWALIKEKCPFERQISLKPNFDIQSKDYLDFKKNQFFQKNTNKLIKKVEDVEKLNVVGKDLFNIEYKREMSGSPNKILHRVFMDNGKMILDKNINEEFGNETIYKSYDKDNKFNFDDEDKIESRIFKSHMFSSANLSNNIDDSRNYYNDYNKNNLKNSDNPLLENSYKP